MKKIILSTVILSAALTTGCATDPYTGERKMSNAGAGSMIGAAAGQVLEHLLVVVKVL